MLYYCRDDDNSDFIRVAVAADCRGYHYTRLLSYWQQAQRSWQLYHSLVSNSRDAVLLAMHLASSDKKKLELHSSFQIPQTSCLQKSPKGTSLYLEKSQKT